MTTYLTALFFIISCGQVTGQSIAKRDTFRLFAALEKVQKKILYNELFQDIRDSLSIIRIDSAKRKYSVKLKNKIEVYGFYSGLVKMPFQEDRLFQINTLIYNSLYINSSTGDIKDLNGWDTSSIVSRAQNAGCSIALTFAIPNLNNVNEFLSNRNTQTNFIKTAIYLMKFRNANMINISFGNFLPEDNIKFSFFIKELDKSLKQEDAGSKLLILVPGIAAGNYYPLTELAGIADRIIIDFSVNYSSTASPLAAVTALEGGTRFFMKSKVLPDKIVICLPYHAAKWATVPFYPHKFIEYISYATLRKNSLFPGYINYVDEESATSEMDSISLKKDTINRIFYDDELTLGFKYKFILDNGFKGVAVNALGEDYGYSNLWDEMSYAFFAKPDTIYVNSTEQIKAGKDLSIFRKNSPIIVSSLVLVLVLILILYITRRKKNYS